MILRIQVLKMRCCDATNEKMTTHKKAGFEENVAFVFNVLS